LVPEALAGGGTATPWATPKGDRRARVREREELPQPPERKPPPELLVGWVDVMV
jgi:hypothetical protein